MNHLKKFQEFSVNEKLYKQGKNNTEENKTSFYEIAKLKEDQKKLISDLVDKTAAENNVKIQGNYKMLIVGKLAGLDDKQIAELEKSTEEKEEEFAKLILVKLAGLNMEQVKAFQEL